MACKQEKKKRFSIFSKGKTDSSSIDVKGVQKRDASSSVGGIHEVSCKCDKEFEYKRHGTRSVITGAQQVTILYHLLFIINPFIYTLES